MLTLISATPSPFARMNRLALLEERIPFTLQNEIPWHPGTQTPAYNPLGKLPILLFDDGRPPVHDSAHILEYIVQKYADLEPKLLTGDLDVGLQARQVVVLAEGLMDAFVLRFWEVQRDEGKRSQLWLDRQNRKIDGAMRAKNDMAKAVEGKGEFLLGGVLTVADIAVVCAVGQVEFAKVLEWWRERLPELAKWWERMEGRRGWRETLADMFDLRGKESI